LPYRKYLKSVSKTEFLISTSGDRDDTYRHYECIGLETIPISNIKYTEIFDNNMIYSEPNEMIDMITSGKVNYIYSKPNKKILTIEYWKNKINERIKNLKII
jgi:hypothetical protein